MFSWVMDLWELMFELETANCTVIIVTLVMMVRLIVIHSYVLRFFEHVVYVCVCARARMHTEDNLYT